jgi:hypothetical protein
VFLQGLRTLYQEMQNVIAQPRILGQINHGLASPRSWDVDVNAFSQSCVWTIRHEGDTVGEQDGLVHIVRHHKDGILHRTPHAYELFLDHAASEGINLGKWFI